MKTFKTIFLVSTLSMVVSFIVIFLWFKEASSQEIVVPCEISSEITRIVAESDLNHEKTHLMQKEFKNGVIASYNPLVLQDLNGRCIAHCFRVINQNTHNHLGYILISAVTSLPPFLQSSDGPLPIDNLDKCESIAIEKIGLTPTSYSLLYLEGILNFFIKFSFPDNKNLILSLDTLHIVSEDRAKNQQLILDHRIEKIKSKANQQWKLYLN